MCAFTTGDRATVRRARARRGADDSAAALVKRFACDLAILAAAIGVLALLSGRAAAADRSVFLDDASGSRDARESIELCTRAASAPPEHRDALLGRGLALAESAVAADQADAKAHFAVFCNLGRRLESRGADLFAVSEVHRLQAEVDRALELAPGFVDASVAKSLLLARLPWFLGGDREQARRLMEAALTRAPEHPPVHRALAELLDIEGDRPGAEREERIAEQLAARPDSRHAAAAQRGPDLAAQPSDADRSGS